MDECNVNNLSTLLAGDAQVGRRWYNFFYGFYVIGIESLISKQSLSNPQHLFMLME